VKGKRISGGGQRGRGWDLSAITGGRFTCEGTRVVFDSNVGDPRVLVLWLLQNASQKIKKGIIL